MLGSFRDTHEQAGYVVYGRGDAWGAGDPGRLRKRPGFGSSNCTLPFRIRIPITVNPTEQFFDRNNLGHGR